MSSWKDIWKTLTTERGGKRYPPGCSPGWFRDQRRRERSRQRPLRLPTFGALIAMIVGFVIMSAVFEFFGKRYDETERSRERSPEYAHAFASWKALRNQHRSFQEAALDDESLEVLRLLDAVPTTAEDKEIARNLGRRIAKARQFRDRELRDRARAKEAALQRQAEEEAQRARLKAMSAASRNTPQMVSAASRNTPQMVSAASLNTPQMVSAASLNTPRLRPGMSLADFEAQFGDCFAFSKKIRLDDTRSADLWDFQPKGDCPQRLAYHNERSVLFADGQLPAFAMRREAGGDEHVRSDRHSRIDAPGNDAPGKRAQAVQPRRLVDAYGNEISEDARQADFEPAQSDPYGAPRSRPETQPVVADPYGAPVTSP